MHPLSHSVMPTPSKRPAERMEEVAEVESGGESAALGGLVGLLDARREQATKGTPGKRKSGIEDARMWIGEVSYYVTGQRSCD